MVLSGLDFQNKSPAPLVKQNHDDKMENNIKLFVFPASLLST